MAKRLKAIWHFVWPFIRPKPGYAIARSLVWGGVALLITKGFWEPLFEALLRKHLDVENPIPEQFVGVALILIGIAIYIFERLHEPSTRNREDSAQINSKLDGIQKLMEARLPEAPARTQEIAQVPLAVIQDRYQRDYEYVANLLENGQYSQVEIAASHLLEQIRIDREHLESNLTAGVFTFRATSRLLAGKVSEANSDFIQAFTTVKVSETVYNYIVTLLRLKQWEKAEEIFLDHCSEITDQIGRALIEADFLIRREKVPEAVELIDGLQPKTPSEHLAVAEFWFHRECYSRVKIHADEALKISRNSPLGMYFLGLATGFPFVNSPSARYSNPGDVSKIKKSISLLLKAQEALCNRGAYLFVPFICEVRANLLVRLGRPEEGLALLDTALQQSPHSISLLDRKYRLLVFEERAQEAAEIAREILKIEESPSAFLREPWAYALNNLFESAKASLAKAVGECESIKENPDFFFLSGFLSMNNPDRNLEKAVEIFSDGIAAFNGNVNLVILRARGYKELGQIESLRADLRTALELPHQEKDLREVAKLFGSIEEWGEADRIFTEQLGIESGLDPCFDVAFDAAVLSGNETEAKRLIKLIDESNPRIEEIRESEADFYARTGKLEEAEKILNAAQGTANRARYNLSQALGKSGRQEKALKILRPCLIHAEDSNFPQLAAFLKFELGDVDGALLFLCNAYELDPANPRIRSFFSELARQKHSKGEMLTIQEQRILVEIENS